MKNMAEQVVKQTTHLTIKLVNTNHYIDQQLISKWNDFHQARELTVATTVLQSVHIRGAVPTRRQCGRGGRRNGVGGRGFRFNAKVLGMYMQKVENDNLLINCIYHTYFPACRILLGACIDTSNGNYVSILEVTYLISCSDAVISI